MVHTRPVILVGDLQQARPQRGFLEALEAQYPDHDYWFLGDCLDSWHSTPIEQVQTLKRVLELCEAGQARCVWSNHDAGYAFPHLNGWCSGWNTATAAMVCTSPLTERMRKAFEPYIAVQTELGSLLVTHAGVSATWLRSLRIRPQDFTLATLDELFQSRAYFSIGTARGGRGSGGPLWSDWHEEFQVFDPWFQVVGHTHLKTGEFQWRGASGGGAVNIDTLGHKGKGEAETLLSIPDLTNPACFKQVHVTL